MRKNEGEGVTVGGIAFAIAALVLYIPLGVLMSLVGKYSGGHKKGRRRR